MTEQTDRARELAVRFHECYERLAPDYGYETREDTKSFDHESKNGKLMVAVCAEMLSFSKAESEQFELYENTLKLIAVPKLQDKYTPQQLAKHALRMEALKP